MRLALGAARRQIVQVLVATSGRAMAIGLLAGFLLSLAYALVCSILLIAGLVATFIPARRAWRVDPAVTLRED